MSISKVFAFDSGVSLTVSIVDSALRFTVDAGCGTPVTLDSCGAVNNRGSLNRAFAGYAPLLSGIVGVDETPDSLTIHANPVDTDSGAPIPAFLTHCRIERAGKNAVRLIQWFDSREPLVAVGFSWLDFRTSAAFDTVCGFDPDYSRKLSTLPHGVHFGSCALSGNGCYVMLSHCGEAAWFPGGNSDDGSPIHRLTAYSFITGSEDISIYDAAHPLTAVFSFGCGTPVLPDVATFAPDAPKAPSGKLASVTSGRLTAAVTVREHGVSLCGISLDDFSPAPDASLLPLVRLTVKNLDTGIITCLTSEHDWETVRVRESEGLLSVYLSHPRGMALSVSVEARAADPDTVEWRTKILNSDRSVTVLDASYPGISFTGGENIHFFKPLAAGIVEADAYSRREHWRGLYPTGFSGVVPVLGVYDTAKASGSGLYCAIHTSAPARTDMTAAFFDTKQGLFSYTADAENIGRPANSFELNGKLVVRVLDGDWYDMAEIYSAHVHTAAEWVKPLGRADSPEWMRDVPMYVMDWMPNDNPDADPIPISVRPPVGDVPRDNWYKKPIELAKRLGLPIGYHLYNWHFIPFNNDYPYYFPVKAGLEEGVEEMHRWGVHVMPYINGRIADTRDTRGENIRFDRDLRPGAAKRMDGELFVETYASHEPDGSLCRLAAMCPTSPAWQDLMSETVRRLFTEYHMDAVYIDQISASSPVLCCDETHNHLPGGGTWWVRAYRSMMERLRGEAPDGCGFTSECCAETYADQFDGFLTWAWIFPDMVPFFPKIYAGYITMVGRNTNGYKKPDAQFFRFHVAQAVMFGQQIGWTNADVVDDPRKIDFLDRMCHLRWDTRAYYTTGSMLRPPVVTGCGEYLTDTSMNSDVMTAFPTTVASAWRGADGKLLITAANIADEDAVVTLTFPAEEYTVAENAEIAAYGDAEILEIGENSMKMRLAGQSAAVICSDSLRF